MNPARLSSVLVCCVASLTVGAATAHADEWAESVSFRRADAAAVKIFEPDGYTASVTVDGEARSGTTPATLAIPDRDDFVLVTLTAPNGAKWSKKIETRKGQITELRVKHAAAAAKSGASRSFIGNVAWDAKSCGGVEGRKPRVDFLNDGGNVARSEIFKTSAKHTLELAAGTYSVRVYSVENDGSAPDYKNTASVGITADGWSGTVLCRKGESYSIEFAK